MSLNNRYIPYILLLLTATLAFYQIVFFVHPPSYDMIDCFYPWRFHVGECLQNGIFPYWNPYQDLGYPEYADPSSGVWYPMVWLIGGTVGYNVYTIGFEFFIHVFLAGVGMFHLAQTLKFERQIAFIAAVSFMLCGIFVGNAQHLPYVIGAAWLPFLLNFYFRMIHERNWSNAIYAGFFLFLMISGGYPAYIIILFYFFILTSIYYLAKSIKHRARFAFSDLLARHIVFVFVACIFSAGMIISIWQVSPFLSRLDEFTLQQALFSPFGPKAFMSFILPYSTVHFPEFFNGDISMINGYFGLFLFLFFIPGIFTRKTSELKFLFGLGIFALCAAVGDALPVRELLFRYVPMMDVFRFPSVFRLFAILAFILVGANYLNVLFKKGIFPEFKKWIIPIAASIALLITLILIIRNSTFLDMSNFVKNAIFHASRDTNLTQHIVFQAAIQICFLGALLLIILFIRNKNLKYNFLIFLIISDLVLSAQLNGPYTVYTEFVQSNEANKSIASLQKGFPEMRNLTIEEAGKLPGLGQPFWQNLNNFHKQISAEGFNSFSFSSYDKLESEFPFIFKRMQQNNLLLLSDKVFHSGLMKSANRDSTYLPDHLFFNNSEFGVLQLLRLKHTASDTAYLTEYDANHFTVRTRTQDVQLLTLFQKDYTGWTAKVNGEETPIYRSNKNFITIVLPEGVSEVEFRYRNHLILGAFGLSVLSCLTLMIYLLYRIRIKEILPLKRS